MRGVPITVFVVAGLILGALVYVLQDRDIPVETIGTKPRVGVLLKECYPARLSHHLDDTREICRQFSQLVRKTAE